MKNTTYFTLGEAAKKTGKSKGTISKYIKSGKLSVASRNSSGYKIDAAELFRVFPPEQDGNVQNERLETPGNTPETFNETRALKKEIEMLREQLEREKDQADRWRGQAERVSLLLTDQREKQTGFLDGLANLWQGKRSTGT